MESYTWTLNANGYWSTAADWSPSGPPHEGASVTIDTPSFHKITLNSGTYSISGLTLGNDELLISGGSALHSTSSFTNTGTASIQSGLLDLADGGTSSAAGIVIGSKGTLEVSGGVLSLGSGSIADAGVLALSGGTIFEAGTLTIGRGIDATGGYIFGGGRVIVRGMTNVAALNVSYNEVLENAGTLSIQQNGSLMVSGFANQGSLVNDLGATLYLAGDATLDESFPSAAIVNNGIIIAQGSGQNTIEGAGFLNAGTIEVASGTLSLGGFLKNTGSIEVSANSSLIITYGGTLTPAKLNIAATGTLDLTGYNFAIRAGTLDGHIELNGEFSLNGRLTLTDGLEDCDADFDGSGELVLNGTSSFSHLSVDTLANIGTLQARNDTFIAAESLLNEAGAMLTLYGGDLNSNQSTTDIINAGILNSFGSYSNLIGGTLTNTGVIEVDSGELDMHDQGYLINTGTIEVLDGATLALEGGSSAPGGIGIAPTGTIEFFGHNRLFGPSQFTFGSGTLAGNVMLESGTIAEAGTLTLTRPFTAKVSQYPGAFSGGGTMVLDGPSYMAGLTIEGNGTVENENTMTGGGLNITSGTLVNDVGARLDLLGGTFAYGAAAGSALVNAGLIVTSDSPSTTIIGADVINTGVITVASGTLEFEGANNSFDGTIEGQGTLAFGGGASSINADATLAVGTITESGIGTTLTLADTVTISTLRQYPRSTLILSGNTLNVTGTTFLAGTVSGSGTLALSGSTTLATGVSLGGTTLAIDAGSLAAAAPRASIGNFIESDTEITITNGCTLTLAVARLAGGTISGPGVLVTRGTVAVSGLALAGGASWTDTSLVDATGALILGAASGGAGLLTIDQAAVFDFTTDASIIVASGGKGRLNNSGLLEKTAGTSVSLVRLAIDNSGTLLVSSGTLAFAGAVSGTGSALIDTASTLGFVGKVAATQTVTFAGSDATLGLLDVTAFQAAIDGFGQDGTGDEIVATTFGTGTNITFTQPNSGEVVATLVHGTSKASIALFGQYAVGSFGYTASASGTVLSYTPPAQIALASPQH